MSPTVFRVGPYRFYFFSREEERVHIHVTCSDGEAKFWLESAVSLAASTGLSRKQLNDIQTIVELRRDEIAEAWNQHFKA